MKVNFVSENSTQFSDRVIETLRDLSDDVTVHVFPTEKIIQEVWESSDLIVWDWCKTGLQKLTSMPKRCPIVAMGKAGDILPRLEYTCIRERCRFRGVPMNIDHCTTYRTIPAIDWDKIDLLLFESPHLLDEFEDLFPFVKCSKHIVLHRNFRYETKTDLSLVAALVCRISVEKDIQFAIETFRELPEWKLIIQGPINGDSSDEWMDKTYYASLRENAPMNVRFVPWGNSYATYREASIILSTSVSEGIASSVMEGMAMGCFPVIRNWPGARQCYPYANVVETPVAMTQALREWEALSLPEKLLISNNAIQAIREDVHKGGENPQLFVSLIKGVVDCFS